MIPSTTLIRTPAHDSAIIRSDRLGGNFAWSTHEGHAYAAISPVVQHVSTPVAVSYHAQPVAYAAHPYIYAAPLAAPAEVKTVETAAHLPISYSYPYAPYAPYAPYTVVKA